MSLACCDEAFVCFVLCAIRTVGVAAVSLAIHLAPVAADCQVECAARIGEHAEVARAGSNTTTTSRTVRLTYGN